MILAGNNLLACQCIYCVCVCVCRGLGLRFFIFLKEVSYNLTKAAFI